MKTLFTLVGGAFSKLFNYVPALKGVQGTAVTGCVNHFVGIGTIMAEGNVSTELGDIAIAKLYEAQLAVNAAIAYGWNNGKGSDY